MKLMKYITGCSAALLLLAACSKEEGPSVDDYFLNYEIPGNSRHRRLSGGHLLLQGE